MFSRDVRRLATSMAIPKDPKPPGARGNGAAWFSDFADANGPVYGMAVFPSLAVPVNFLRPRVITCLFVTVGVIPCQRRAILNESLTFPLLSRSFRLTENRFSLHDYLLDVLKPPVQPAGSEYFSLRCTTRR